MATPTLQTSTGSESIIAGYFQSGEDAHRAINALLDEGFLPSQIGAAFHTGGGSVSSPDPKSVGIDTMREDLGTTISSPPVSSEVSDGGPASDTSAVQPVGLASGTGTPIFGAGKPGPISGSSLAHTGLPSELESELAHEQPGSAGGRTVPATPVTTGHAQPTTATGSSWSSKLKHLFQSKPDHTTTHETTTQDQNFGTGEGKLDLARPYSATAFENSVSSAGVSPDSSRHLSSRLSTGGAVVTVSDSGRSIEVERIFEQHNGVVRFSSDVFNDSPALDYEPRVEVFGHLEHRYPAL